jgi:murein L,D-transpeptidase YcbB/YkuD
MTRLRVKTLRLLCAALALCGAAAAAADGMLWIEGARPGPQALQAVERLAGAASHGLDPQDYGTDALRQRVTSALQGPPLAPEAAAGLEQALTAAMERYLLHLYLGRIDPRQVYPKVSLPRQDGFDAAGALRAALAAGSLEQAERQAVPRLPLYENLRQALATQRALVGHEAWRQALPPLPPTPGSRTPKLEPGQPYAGLAQLAQRLAALGDLTAPAAELEGLPSAVAVPLYEGALVDAMKRFQQRHGLKDDGVVGASTLKQLQVAPAERVRQIELTLERLRWTPLLHGPRMIVANIPAFVLTAYEVREDGVAMRQTMRVIVGKSVDARTPLFDQDLSVIEFSPYWNVPASIARKELVPRLRRDPAHFARQGYEFVGVDGRVSTTLTPALLDGVLAGRQRLRQRPGPRNALGEIKFVLPNSGSIYLHHTPSTQLFERDRRDFSHGCIRLEDPVALARFVLEGQPEWTEERIRDAMAAGKSNTLRLTDPVRVVITYGTVIVRDGRTYFYDDIYGHDRLLDAALRRSSAVRSSPASPS